MGSFKYALRDGTRLIIRHWGLAFLTVVTSMAVFYLIGASVLLVLNARHIVNFLEGELSVQAYLTPGADFEIAAQQAAALSHVKEVRIITREMALERLKQRMPDRAESVTILGENPLPASLEIAVDRADSIESVVTSLAAIPLIDDIVYAGGLAEKWARFSRFAGKFSLAILLVAITASAVVLFNTIRIAVYSKEEEIGIMLMVGATPTFVAMPFVLQGVILGGIGSFGASVFLALSYSGIVARLKEMVPFLPLVEQHAVVLELGLILVGAGATVSLIASLVAVETFTRRAMKPL
ncbi:MAG: permease-like cell division protein FtsX [Synergistaceae bacterium]|jgi:cell division transport system permease protein|nr:permease-like cell division protein FtsX [Synergistaceae bacterium]